MAANHEEVRLGDYVELTSGRMGMIKYVGDIHGKNGTYYGVELWKGDGKHSGTYEGIEYFECINPGMGVFVVPKAILYILDVPKDYDPFQKLQEKRLSQQKKRQQTNGKYTHLNKHKDKGINTNINQSRFRSNSKPSKTPKTKRTNQTQSKQQQSIRSKYIKHDEKDSIKPDVAVALRDGSESVMSIDEFKSISLREYIGKGDNFDIAKRICKFYDDLFGDTDTVCLVANIGLKPSYSLSLEGGYKRIETFNREGKYVIVYRARFHIDSRVAVSKQCFKSVVKGLALDYENASDVVNNLNLLFGTGCHVVRCKKMSFDIYSRFSDGYECELRLPNGGDYVLAWRR